MSDFAWFRLISGTCLASGSSFCFQSPLFSCCFAYSVLSLSCLFSNYFPRPALGLETSQILQALVWCGLWGYTAWVQILALLVTSSVTLGKLLNISVPQMLPL